MRAFVTGFAGFIGSHLTERLLLEGYKVTGVDNFSTGCRDNIRGFEREIDWLMGDVSQKCNIYPTADVVFHLAAMGSVPRSIETPDLSIKNNVMGSTNVLCEAVKRGCRKIILASSSSVYGDDITPIRQEARIGRPMSPYAASKRSMEIVSETFAKCYPIEVVNLRFFNVFGPRQRPDGPYAAVIAKWLPLDEITIYGDGGQVRDYTYVSNVIDALMLAAQPSVKGGTYNVGCGQGTSLLELASLMNKDRIKFDTGRRGDVRHSIADISLAKAVLSYEPRVSISEGLHKMRCYYEGQENRG